MPIPGNLRTTAMAVMPHEDAGRALEIVLTLDIPFWPQLPNLSYHEDMYVQASEHFPGMVVDIENRTLRFSLDRFIEELDDAMSHDEDPCYLDISEDYSMVYHTFLSMNLERHVAIHGQLEGPISFGFNVLDQDDRSILFDETIRSYMLEFMARRVNIQLYRLKEKNENAFMYIDEPGLQYIFSALSGYNNITAQKDMELFLSLIQHPRGIHLCGNPDWDFLLNLDLDILSLDVFTNGEVISAYAKSIKRFIEKGKIICWGIVPTNQDTFDGEMLNALEARLLELFKSLEKVGLNRERLLSQSLLSPATCCLINPDREKTVEKAFGLLTNLSKKLRDKYRLD